MVWSAIQVAGKLLRQFEQAAAAAVMLAMEPGKGGPILEKMPPAAAAVILQV